MKKYRKPTPGFSALDIPLDTPLVVKRHRSAGVLTRGELAASQAEGVPLSFDPMQQGWVPSDCEDDLSLLPQNAVASGLSRAKRTPSHHAYKMRPWGMGDVEAYVELLDDPDVWRFLPEDYPNPVSRDLAVALIELSNASNHHQVFAVERSGTVIGQVRLEYDVEPNNPASAEISYWLGRDHWGKGIGSDITTLFTARCLRDNPALTSLIARVHKDNTASLNVLGKAGYEVEGPDTTRPDWLRLRVLRD